MADRTTKLLLLAIAVGLWMNVVGQLLRPAPVQAAVENVQSERTLLRNISTKVDAIWGGYCPGC
jgi:hypothetical protein